jgi:DNA-binding MarR family transcriptional regulator
MSTLKKPILFKKSQSLCVKDLLAYKLKKTQHRLRLCMDEALKSLGLTTPQYAVLAQLEIQPGISSAALARAAFITPQSMHAIVLNLERQKLIQRQADPKHGRILRAELSIQGQELVQKAHACILDVEEKMLATISPTNKARLEALLRECFDNLQRTDTAYVF